MPRVLHSNKKKSLSLKTPQDNKNNGNSDISQQSTVKRIKTETPDLGSESSSLSAQSATLYGKITSSQLSVASIWEPRPGPSPGSSSTLTVSQWSQYSQAPSTLNQDEKLEWLLTRRMVGTWIQCDRCDKWRYIKDIHDPSIFPEQWFCRLNQDITKNYCNAEEDPIPARDKDLLIQNAYAPGSVVWALVDGYPWWPGLVDDDPDSEQYYFIEDYDKSRKPSEYHVVFLDKSLSWDWVQSSKLRPWRDMESANLRGKERSLYGERMTHAMKCAKEACKMGQVERVRTFGYLARLKKEASSGTSKRQLPVLPLRQSRQRSDSSSDSMSKGTARSLRSGSSYSTVY